MAKPSYSANGLFLGVVEDEKSHMVGRHTMRVTMDVDFRLNSRDAMQRKVPTPVYLVLERSSAAIYLDLIFTDRSIHDKFQLLYDPNHPDTRPGITVNKVLNIDKARLNRTIFEVRINGIDKIMVLKCIDSKTKNIEDESVVTVTQQEVKAFEALPDSLKGIFVEKYGHGRLWFGVFDHCEVVLMEKMCSTDMHQAFTQVKYDRDNIDSVSEQLKWLAEAFGLLHKVHKAGFSHGDPHPANLLWTDGIGQGTMKFIDPERMLNLNVEGTDNETKAIRKLSDVGYLLFRNALTLLGLSPDLHIECDTLHKRLKRIKSRLTESFVFLDDTLPYTDYYEFAGVVSIEGSKQQWRRNNPTQYEKMKTEDFGKNLDDFILNMSNPQYLQKVFHYIILEINRAALKFTTIDDKDLDVPHYPGQVVAVSPAQVTRQSGQQVVQPLPASPNAATNVPGHLPAPLRPHQITETDYRQFADFPLRYGIFNIQIYDHTLKNLQAIYYKANPGGSMSLIAYDGKTTKPYDGSTIQNMFSGGTQMYTRYDQEDLYFNFDYETGDLMVYKPNPNPSLAHDFIFKRRIRNSKLNNYPNFGS